MGDSTPIAKFTAQDLREVVTYDYLRGLEDNILSNWYTAETKTADRGRSDEQAGKGYLFHHNIDIVLPTVKSCKPRLSEVIQ